MKITDHIIFHHHIPKCAGTSVANLIEQQYPPEDVFRGSLYELIRLGQKRRDEIKVLSGHYHYGIHGIFNKQVKSFVFLRSPADRVQSYLSRRSVDVACDNGMVRTLSGELAPFGKCTKGMLEKAKQHLNSYAFVGFVENLNDDIKEMNELFGWSGEVGCLNKTAHKKDYPVVSMTELNKLDIELYNYAVSNRPQRITCRNHE
jgi:hypothetical protein